MSHVRCTAVGSYLFFQTNTDLYTITLYYLFLYLVMPLLVIYSSILFSSVLRITSIIVSDIFTMFLFVPCERWSLFYSLYVCLLSFCTTTTTTATSIAWLNVLTLHLASMCRYSLSLLSCKMRRGSNINLIS